ncbi:co-chaperone YbbN [Arthrospira sp. O9.13F]|nr:co-chaperone YbbN [Arthrospira sp. O9.13F]
MGYAIDVNQDNFQAEVIDKSWEKLVMVDFFATWCGPCQIMKPILERLTTEYDFILAKVDVDHNPELASQYGIEGVPDVRMVTKAEVKPGFVGAIAEPQLRELLAGFNLKSELENGLSAIDNATHSGNLKQAKNLFDFLFEKYPNHPELIIKAAQFLIAVNEIEAAQKMLATIRPDNREFHAKARAVEKLIEFRVAAENPGETEIEQLYAQACQHIINEEYDAGLSLFLKIVGISRKYREDGARKAMIAVFDLLGPDHPLIPQYRKQLMLQLY